METPVCTALPVNKVSVTIGHGSGPATSHIDAAPVANAESVTDTGTVDVPGASCDAVWWADASTSTCYVAFLSGQAVGRVIDVAFPTKLTQCIVTGRVLPEASKSSQLAWEMSILWLSESTLWVAGIEIRYTSAGADISQSVTASATLSLSGRPPTAMARVPNAYDGGRALLLVTDSDGVWRARVSNNGDVAEEVFIAPERPRKNLFSLTMGGSSKDQPTKATINALACTADGIVLCGLSNKTMVRYVYTHSGQSGEPVATDSLSGSVRKLTALSDPKQVMALFQSSYGEQYVTVIDVSQHALEPVVKLPAPVGSAKVVGMSASSENVLHVLWSVESHGVMPFHPLGLWCTQHSGVTHIVQRYKASDVSVISMVNHSASDIAGVVEWREQPFLLRSGGGGDTSVSWLRLGPQLNKFESLVAVVCGMSSTDAISSGDNSTYGAPCLPSTVLDLEHTNEGTCGMPDFIVQQAEALANVEGCAEALTQVLGAMATNPDDIPSLFGSIQFFFRHTGTEPYTSKEDAHMMTVRALRAAYSPFSFEGDAGAGYTARHGNSECVYHMLLQDVLSRLTLLAVAFSAMAAHSDHRDTPQDIRTGFKWLFAILQVVRAIGEPIVQLAEGNEGTPQEACGNILTEFLPTLPQDEATLPLASLGNVVRVARALASIPGPAGRAAAATWSAAWVADYSALNHYLVLASAAQQSNLDNLAGLLHSVSHALLSMEHTSACALVSQFELGAEHNLGDTIDALFRRCPEHVGSLYRLAMLRTLLRRIDTVTVESLLPAPDLEHLVFDIPTALSQLKLVAPDDIEPLIDYSTLVLGDVWLVVVRHALNSCDIVGAFRHIAYYCRGIVPDSHERRVVANQLIQELVAACVDSGAASQLLQLSCVSDESVCETICQKLYEYRGHFNTPTEREEQRIKTIMILHGFLLSRRAFGAAAGVTYELACSLRTAHKCTSSSLLYASQTLELAVNTLHLIPKVPPPNATAAGGAGYGNGEVDEGDVGMSSGGFGDSFCATHSMQTMPILAHTDLDRISRYVVQVRCEQNLSRSQVVQCLPWHDGQQDTENAKSLLKDLLAARLWDDAIKLSLAFGLLLDDAVACYVSDTISNNNTTEVWTDVMKHVLKHSTPANGHRYLAQAVSLALHHRPYQAYRPLVLALQRANTSALMECYLCGDDLPRAVITAAMQLGREYIEDKTGTRPQPGAFSRFGITITQLERVAAIASRCHDSRNVDAAVGALATEYLRLYRAFCQ